MNYYDDEDYVHSEPRSFLGMEIVVSPYAPAEGFIRIVDCKRILYVRSTEEFLRNFNAARQPKPPEPAPPRRGIALRGIDEL